MGEGFQFFDIILFAMIAVFLILRLRSVLGRRDGHEGGFPDPFKRNREDAGKPAADTDNVAAMPKGQRDGEEASATGILAAGAPDDHFAAGPAADEGPLAGALLQIQMADPDFAPADFAERAHVAFEMVLSAYASGDYRMLKDLLSPDVYADFERNIREREQAGHLMEETLVGIQSADIVDAELSGRIASVTVKFVSEQVYALRDEEGAIVDGNPNQVDKVVDFWTFSRDTGGKDPNWLLSATRSLE